MSNNYITTGTPRGFNLAAMQHPMNGMGGFPSPAAFNGMATFGNHMVQMPGFNGQMMDNNLHQAGPIRRGGGRFQNQRPVGPYDRKQQRYSNGRLSPPRGAGFPSMQGGRGGPGKWGDGVGAQAIGPREAVQGRSLKSYEDLDAVAGGGSGELNY